MSRFLRWSAVGLFLVLVAGACSTTADMAGLDEAAAAASSQEPGEPEGTTGDAPAAEATDGAPAGPDDVSTLPRPATADERITPERLRDAFEATADLPALQLLEISTTTFDKLDLHAHQRRIVSQNVGGDGVGVLFEGTTSQVGGPNPGGVESRSAVFGGQLWSRDAQAGAGWTARSIDSPQLQEASAALTNAFFYLAEIEQAVTGDPVFTSVFPDGTRRVSLEFDAGAVGTLALAGLVSIDGFSDPLEDLAGVTKPLPGFIEISPDGRILGAQVDVSAWHLATLSYVTAVDGEKRFAEYEQDAISGLYSMAFALVNGELVVQQGCIDVGVSSCIVDSAERTDGDPATESTSTGELTTVLVANVTIAAGTLIDEITDSPTLYVTSQSLPDAVVVPDAIGSIAELRELGPDLVIASDVLAGEQLLSSQFTVAADCPLDAPLPQAEGTSQVLVTTVAIPLGTSVRQLIETPTVYLSAQLTAIDALCPTALSSLANLAALPADLITVDVPPGVILDRRHFMPG